MKKSKAYFIIRAAALMAIFALQDNLYAYSVFQQSEGAPSGYTCVTLDDDFWQCIGTEYNFISDESCNQAGHEVVDANMSCSQNMCLDTSNYCTEANAYLIQRSTSFECCMPPCDTCNSSTDDWIAAATTGYQQQTTTKSCATGCTCANCTSFTNYRCAPGYYGSSTNGTSGCTACPTGGTSNAGSTAITGCYLPADTTGNDASGNFEYESNCPYVLN